MGFQDLFITPIYILLLSAMAIAIRPYVTTPETRKFFLPALWVRFAGAILLGVIYQFYYGSGDTFNYWTHGSRWIYEAFLDDPMLGLQLLLENGGQRQPETFQYSQHIWYYRDTNSYIIVRIAAFFDLITFHTYSATALFFACFSFSGIWALFSAVRSKYPNCTKWLALGILFFPSVVFWGSGILKDTITLGALGWAVWALVSMIEFKEISYVRIIVLLSSLWLIFSIKVYIIICLVPMIFIWLFFKNINAIKNIALRILTIPVLLIIFGTTGFFSLREVASSNNKYTLNSLAERARITAYDIRYGWGARLDGDGGYDIGIPDGTIPGMLRLAPAAVNVTLFRPYPWEVKNPLMALAALESIAVFSLSIWIMILKGGLARIIKDPFLLFCLSFAILFAFAVGVSTFNFGTLMRYKIPMMPFLLTLIICASNAPSGRSSV